jgi:cytochrome P450
MSEPVVPTSAVDLVAPAAVRDPHAAFAMLHALGPIVWLERHKAWIVVNFDLVRTGLTDERFSTDTITPLYQRLSPEEREQYADAETLLRGWMIFNDEPTHSLLRLPVRSAFTPAAVTQLAEEITELTDRMLASLPESFDFVRDVAFPLPAGVIALLLGVDSDRVDDLGEWSKQLGALVMGKVSRPDAWGRALAAAHEMQRYFGALVERYRQQPTDNLIGRLIAASAEEKEQPLTPQQIIGACSLLLFGGHETTTSLLTTCAYHICLNDELRDVATGTEPEVASFVEEILRFDGPSKIFVRRVREDMTWHGVSMRANQPVYLAVAAADRDGTAFDEPDRLRSDRHPNRHLAFGWGPHFCLGAQLARLEARIIIPRLLRAFPNIALNCKMEELAWHPTIVGRTIRKLPMRTHGGEPQAAGTGA